MLSAQLDAVVAVLAGQPLADALGLLLETVEQASSDGMLASVLLADDDGRHLRHGAAPSLPGFYNEAIDGIEIGPAAGSCGTAAYRRQPVVAADIATDPAWEAFRDLAAVAGLAACWSIPIFGADHDSLLGTFAMYYPQPQEPSPADLALGAVLARTVALAIERSRLDEQLQRELAAERGAALTLQHSLLTPPIAPDHLQVAVRYRPAREGAEVGGDWYDSFLLPDGCLGVVIGDVVGHDLIATAAMGQLRSTLRAVACHTGEAPSVVLTGVDKLMDSLLITDFATAVYAKIEGPVGGPHQLRWANAGHPPALLVLADGTTKILEGGTGPALGAAPGLARGDAVDGLPDDSTLLLYTDGLVETRTDGLDECIAALAEHISGLASLDIEDFCDAVLTFGPGNQDDVALLAVRLPPGQAHRGNPC